MTTLDYNTATALDIINRSIIMHPSLFADVLKARYYEDRAYAAQRKEETATYRSVMASAEAAAKALSVVDGALPLEYFKDHMGAGIIALNLACKLQCIPPHVRTQAALRTWPQD